VSFVIAILLSLINIGSTVAFNAIAALGVAALISSYTISISCITIKKWRKELLPPSRWSMGSYGIVVNFVSVLYLILVLILSFFPLVTPVDPETMNWSSLIYGTVVLFSLVYYFILGKHRYRGPVVHVKPIYDE
jgi:choline transport protein